MEDHPCDNDDYTFKQYKLQQSEESQRDLREQNLSLLLQLNQKDQLPQRQSEVNPQALKKFDLENERFASAFENLEKQIALYERDRQASMEFENDDDERVAVLEQNLLLVIDELKRCKNQNDLMVDSSSTCTIGEKNLLVSLLASLTSKDDDSTYAFLEANYTDNESSKRLLSMWSCLEPSIQRVISLVAKIKSLQKDKEHLRINLHKAEEEVKLLFDENSILEKENRRLSKKCKEKNYSSSGEKLLQRLNSFTSSLSFSTIKFILFLMLALSLLCLAQNQPFHYFSFVILWSPTYCYWKVGGADCSRGAVVKEGFYLHGFWPENRAPLSQPQNCRNTDLFGVRVQVISHNLEVEMTKWWPSLTMENRHFWNHEWRKHGTCSRMTERRYVHAVLDKIKRVDIFGELQHHNIMPQYFYDTPIEYHDYVTFQNILGNKFLPMEEGIERIQIRLLCTRGQLYAVEACADNQGVFYVDCPNRGTCDQRSFRYVRYVRPRKCPPCVSPNLSVKVPTASRLFFTILFSIMFSLAAGASSFVPPQAQVSTVRSSVPPKAQISIVRSAIPPQTPVSTVRCSVPTQMQVSTVCSSIPAQRLSEQACGSPAKGSENPVSMSNAIPACELKPVIVHSGAQTVSRSNAMPQLKVAQVKNVVHTVPASSSWTKTPISAGLPSDQKVHSNVPAGSFLTKTSISAGLASDQKVSYLFSVPPQAQVSTVRSSVPPQAQISTVRSSVPPQAQISTVRSSVPPQMQVSTVRSSVPPQTPVSTVRCSVPTQTQVSTVRSSIPAQRLSQQACGSPAKGSENPISKNNAIPACELKPATVHSGAQTVSRSNAMPQLKVAQVKNVVHTVPASSSLTKTPISAGLPSDQKVHSNVPAGSSLTKTSISAGLASDRKEHVTSVKEGEKKVSDLGSAPKEVKEEEASTLNTQSKVDSKLDTARLYLDKAKSMPSEKVLEHKAVSHNSGECEEQGSVKNSDCTPKKATENINGNLNKESQVLNQDKKTVSITGSSNHQNVNEKLVNLPKQGECRQGLEVP